MKPGSLSVTLIVKQLIGIDFFTMPPSRKMMAPVSFLNIKTALELHPPINEKSQRQYPVHTTSSISHNLQNNIPRLKINS